MGNLQKNDTRYGGRNGSNYGPTVDIFAPGTDIVSAWRTTNFAVRSLSGTSMAAPHVAGLVSYLRGLGEELSAEAVKKKVLELATKGRVVDDKGAANLVPFNGAESK